MTALVAERTVREMLTGIALAASGEPLTARSRARLSESSAGGRECRAERLRCFRRRGSLRRGRTGCAPGSRPASERRGGKRRRAGLTPNGSPGARK